MDFFYLLENYSRRVRKSTNKKIWPYIHASQSRQSLHRSVYVIQVNLHDRQQINSVGGARHIESSNKRP